MSKEIMHSGGILHTYFLNFSRMNIPMHIFSTQPPCPFCLSSEKNKILSSFCIFHGFCQVLGADMFYFQSNEITSV